MQSCLDGLPRHRQRVQRMPLDLARPVWVDDPHFLLDYHLRHTAIPAPGGDEQLRNLFGRVLSNRLDLDRPLWELWFVEGLTGDRWALITKTHHAMIDGLAGNELMEVLLDSTPDATRRPSRPWHPADAAVATRAHGIRRGGHRPATGRHGPRPRGRGSARPRLARRPGEGRRRAGASGWPAWGAGPWRRPACSTARWGRTAAGAGPGPSSPTSSGSRRPPGCSVNDVVLAAVAGGFREYLLSRGEDVETTTIRSLVPVSVRTQEHAGQLGNHVTAMFADLPVAVAGPRERLAVVAHQMTGLKGSGQSIGVESMLAAADFVPATLMTLGAKVYAFAGQRVVNTVTTNIPGPQHPLYLLGHRMLELFPYIPVAQTVRISIGILSYDGHLTIGVTGDYDAVPDIDVLCTAIERSLDELVGTATTV